MRCTGKYCIPICEATCAVVEGEIKEGGRVFDKGCISWGMCTADELEG